MQNALGRLLAVGSSGPVVWALALLVGCSNADPKGFVGQLAGADSRFGLVIEGDEGELYVCGGEVDRARHHDWFAMARSDAGFAGQSATGQANLVVDGDVVSGTITIDDETFEATGTRAQGADGLYEADREEGACRLGTVVANGGEVVQGVFCPDATSAVQVVPIDFDADLAAQRGFDVETATEPPVQFEMRSVLGDGGE